MVRRPVLSHFDFSFCTTVPPGQFIEVSFESCRFVGSNFERANFGSRAIGCDFSRAKLCKWLRGRYENCRFVGAEMTRIVAQELTFVRCDFTGANWRKAVATDSTFENCTWDGCKFGSGSFCSSRFVGTRPDAASLGNTMMEDITFA